MIRKLKKDNMGFLRQLKHEVRRTKMREIIIIIIIHVSIIEPKFNRCII